MQCPHCNAQLEDDTVFCGNCGTQITRVQAQGAKVPYKGGEGEDDLATVISTRQSYQPPTPQTPVRNNALQPDTPYRGGDTPTILSSPPPARKNNTWRIAFIVVLVLLIIGVGTIGTIALLNKQNHTSVTNNRSSRNIMPGLLTPKANALLDLARLYRTRMERTQPNPLITIIIYLAWEIRL